MPISTLDLLLYHINLNIFAVQACIDDNLDMVEFLVEHGADINRGDHEGWTPLHATASCGFLSIARYADIFWFVLQRKSSHHLDAWNWCD